MGHLSPGGGSFIFPSIPFIIRFWDVVILFFYVRTRFFFFAVCCCFLWSFFSRLTKQTLHTGSSHIGGYNHHNNEVRYITVGGWAKQRIIYYTSDTLLVLFHLHQSTCGQFICGQFIRGQSFCQQSILVAKSFCSRSFCGGQYFFCRQSAITSRQIGFSDQSSTIDCDNYLLVNVKFPEFSWKYPIPDKK